MPVALTPSELLDALRAQSDSIPATELDGYVHVPVFLLSARMSQRDINSINDAIDKASEVIITKRRLVDGRTIDYWDLCIKRTVLISTLDQWLTERGLP